MMTAHKENEAVRFESVLAILDRYERDPSQLIPIMQAVQEKYRYLPEEILAFVAVSLDLSPAKVYGVATFYGHFSLEAKGRYVIRVCDGTACHVKGSTTLVEALRAELGLTEKKKTTDDLLFTVETVSCLGACGLAPVLTVNEDVHGLITPAAAIAVVKAICEKEAAHGAN